MFHIYLGGQLIYQPLDADLALFNPKLTLEMGKAGSLEFDIPPSNSHYSDIQQLTSIVTADMDGDEIFRGRVLSNERMFNNVRHIYCEGDLAFLVDSVQKTEKYNGRTRALFNKMIAAHNSRVEASKQFTVGQVTIDDRDIILTGQSEDINTGDIDYKQIAIDSIVDEWNSTYEQIQTCLIDYCGGYLRTRYQNGVNYIDYVKEYGGTASQEIELGKNLLDLTEEVSVEDLFTVLIPLGDDNLTIKSANNGSDELVDSAAVAKYGRIVKTHVFNNVNDPGTLLENARRYLTSNVNVPRTVTITAVDLHLLDKSIAAIHLGDKVHISSGPHSMDEYLMCTKIEYDMANPANNKYTFGNPKQTLTERYKEDKRAENDTYGNGGGGGSGRGGGAAAAAEAAADAAAEDAETELDHFFTTYIDLDDETGIVSLGAMLKQGKIYKNLLKSEVGIDLDASTGNVNIRSLQTRVDDNSGAIARQSARIDVLQEDTQVSLTSLTERIEEVNGIHQEHYTSISQIASQNASQISIVTGELYDEIDRAKAKEASIDLIVENQQSQINIKADKINLDAAVTRISNLEADVVDASKLKARIAALDTVTVNGTLSAAGGLRASSITLGNNEPVYSYMHYHSLSEENGVVKLGPATTVGPTSFSIADTKFYKDGVSAAKTEGAQSATIRSLGINSVGSPYVYNGSRYEDAVIGWSVQATQGDGNLYTTSGTLTKAVNVDAAYNQGVNSVTVSSLGAAWSGYKLTGTAKASNGASRSATWDATWIYNKGYSDGQDAGSGGIDKIYITMISGSSVGVRAYFGSSYNFAWLSPGAYWDGG